MHTLTDFLIDLGITALVGMPLFFASTVVLWKLRSRGIWTIALGPVAGILLSNLLLIACPSVLRYHYDGVGTTPVETGIMVGWIVPTAFTALYHLAERKKKKGAAEPQDDSISIT